MDGAPVPHSEPTLDDRPPLHRAPFGIEGSAEQQQDGETPAMSPLLRLSPAHLEADFWGSAHMQATSRTSDWWASCLLLITDIMYFKWQLSRPRQYFPFWPCISHCTLQLSSTLVQLAFIVVCGSSYSRWRPTALAINRALRIAIIAGLAVVCRIIYDANPKGIDPMTGAPFPPFGTVPTLPEAIRMVVFMSGSLLAFMTLLLPLPWKQQLATQLLVLAPLLSLHLPLARTLIHTLCPLGPLQQLCNSLNATLDLLSIAYLGSSTTSTLPAHSSSHCKAHAVEMLLLFADLYVGLFLPVYFTYRMERQHKLAFLRQLLQQQGRRPPPVDGLEADPFAYGIFRDVLVLLLAAGQVWVVATLTHGFLRLIEIPA